MVKIQKRRSLNFKDFLEFPNIVLRIAFFKPFNEHKLKSSLISRVLMYTTPVILFINYITMVITLCTKKTKSVPMILHLSDLGSSTGLATVAILKMFMLFFYRKNITELFDELDRYYPGKMKLHHCYRHSRYKIKELYEFSRNLMNISFHSLTWSTVFYNLQPLTQSTYRYLVKGENFKFRLQMKSCLQRDEDSLVEFIWNYLLQLVTSSHMVAFIMAGDFVLCFFLTQLRLHYEFLVSILETMDAAEAEKDPGCMVFLVNYHNRLNRIVKEINQIFGVSFLINFTTSSIAMCLMGYSAVMGISIYNITKYSVGLCDFFISTLFICYNGNKLTETTDKLPLAAFHHNWYDAGPIYRKTIMIMMVGFSKPPLLQAYKFAPVSMETFMNILKFSYKLFTCFRAM